MPIRVTVEVEERRALTLHIARITDSIERKPGKENTYAVIVTDKMRADPLLDAKYRDETPHPGEWEKSPVRFQHTYGEGLETCVSKALLAYQEHENQRKAKQENNSL